MIDINKLWLATRPQIPLVYDESLSYLESIARLKGGVVQIAEQSNENKENLNKKVSYEDMQNIYKLDQNADFTGSWFGIKKPTASNEGLGGAVDQLLEETIPQINNNIKIIQTQISNFKNVDSFKNILEVDDTIAIRKALESEYNIVFNKRKYYINERMNIALYNGKIVEGNNAEIVFTGGISTTEVSQEGIITFSGENNHIKNLIVDVNGQWKVRPFTWQAGYNDYITLRKKNYSAVNFDGCDNLIVENMIFKNGRNGSVVKNTTNFIFKNINMYKMMADGIFITDGCAFGIVRDCYGQECNDDVYACDGYSLDPAIQPHNVIFDNCNSHNCVGALVCLEGSYNTKFINSTGTEIKHKPFKTGLMRPYAENPILAYGSYQIIENCKFSLADTLQGDSNGELESVNCGVQIGDNVTLRNVDIVKPKSAKQFELQFKGTNYLLDNVKIRNTGLSFYKMQNVEVKNCNFNINDALYIVEGTTININDSFVNNQNLAGRRGATPIIYSGYNHCKLFNTNLTTEGTSDFQVELIGNYPTYGGFDTDVNLIKVPTATENLKISGVYTGGTIPDGRFRNGQLVYDQYGFGIIMSKSRIKIALKSDLPTV